MAHAGRAMQRRRSQAAGARVHIRTVLQQNLAHVVMPTPRCVMQRCVAGSRVRRIDEDALLQ